MTDKTSRDIRLGDLSGIDATGTQEPRLGAAEVVNPTGAARRRAVPVVADAPLPGGQSSTGRAGMSWPLVTLSAFVVLLAGVVGALLLQQRGLSLQLATLQSEARMSVETLENRVASTNTTLKSADSETQQAFNLIAADIGRLDKSLTRIGQALEQEAKVRDALNGDLQVLATDTRKAVQALTQANAQLETKFDARAKALADNLDQFNARLKAQADSLARLERSSDAAQLRSEVAVLGASIRQLQDDHEKRLKSIEQVAGSNDAFRRQVNTTIDRLNQQVSELYQRR